MDLKFFLIEIYIYIYIYIFEKIKKLNYFLYKIKNFVSIKEYDDGTLMCKTKNKNKKFKNEKTDNVLNFKTKKTW